MQANGTSRDGYGRLDTLNAKPGLPALREETRTTMGATAKTLLLMGVLTGILAGLGYMFLGGWPGVIIFLVIAGAFNIFAYWKSDSLALRMAGAREVSPEQAPRLHRIVDEVTAMTSLPKPKVYVVENPSPNAFATGRNPKHAVVAATTGIMNLLDDRELKGVIAHELGHVGNRDILIGAIVAVFAGAIGMIAQVLGFRMMFGGFGNRDDDNGNPLLDARRHHPAADRRDDGTARDLAHARVRGGPHGREDDARPGCARRRAREARAGRGAASDAGQPGDSAHVHREPAGCAARARSSRSCSARTRRSRSASRACARWPARACSSGDPSRTVRKASSM